MEWTRCCSRGDTKIAVPFNRAGKVVRTALNCPFIDCQYTAEITRVSAPNALLKKHLHKMQNIHIVKFEHRMEVLADGRVCNRLVAPGKNTGTEDMDTELVTP